MNEVEGILIASMPTANAAVPRIKLISLPGEVGERIRQRLQRQFEIK
jgi:hypothetical protein